MNKKVHEINDEKLRQLVHTAADECFVELDRRPSLEYRIMSRIDQESRGIARRKPALALVFALIAALLLTGTMIAASLGLFGEFAQHQDPYEGASLTELNHLERLATDYNLSQTVTVDDKEVTFTLRQAYCDGIRLYFSYETDGDDIGDGATLSHGSVADIREGNAYRRKDGMLVGYRTLQLPEDVELGETVTFWVYVGWNKVPFTIDVNAPKGKLSGSAAAELYTAEAEFTQTDIVLKGVVRLDCPLRWTQTFWFNGSESEIESTEHSPSIIGYVLTNGRERFQSTYTAIGAAGDGLLEIHLLFDLPEDLTNLSLIPFYSNEEERPEEAIPLVFEKQ